MNEKQKNRLNELLAKALKTTGGLNASEVKELGELFKLLSQELEEREGEKLSEKLPDIMTLKLAEVAIEQYQKDKEVEEFKKSPLAIKLDMLNEKADKILSKRQKLEEKKEKKEFDEFYEAHARKYNY